MRDCIGLLVSLSLSLSLCVCVSEWQAKFIKLWTDFDEISGQMKILHLCDDRDRIQFPGQQITMLWLG